MLNLTCGKGHQHFFFLLKLNLHFKSPQSLCKENIDHNDTAAVKINLNFNFKQKHLDSTVFSKASPVVVFYSYIIHCALFHTSGIKGMF